MLKKDYLSECLNKMWEIAVDSLCVFSETQRTEELHRLRVEIKKLFALTALLQFNTPDFDFFSRLKSVKAISLKAGEIRNIQLTLQTIRRYLGKDSPLYETQNTRLINLTKMFCSKTALYVKNLKKAHKSVLRKICDIETDCVLNWYEDELRKLAQFFDKQCDQKNMHEGRKALKKLLYVYAILHKPFQNKLKLNKHYLRKLEETIGEWHDAAVSMEILSHSSSNGNETMKKLSDRKQKLLKSCCALSKHFSEKSVTD